MVAVYGWEFWGCVGDFDDGDEGCSVGVVLLEGLVGVGSSVFDVVDHLLEFGFCCSESCLGGD